ncbi:NUDIX hydrolase [Caldinitratiruptor microaerophilus]|uniref:ADP-ribose pyrophosphatase n=1 Tax=Caldinitratiruptor microaerophilus TaxID=671077 RepID=A0AA35CK91_9FIRM|nr:NUDIX hydrolase [Caldinitratiruptor microaerophilus]BDG59948.1 ADP-ribose pyrophosphatase [Caldinitratiruptor microaerophilus]
MPQEPNLTRLSSETMYESRVFRVHRDRVRLPGGLTVTREVVEHPGAVVMVPILDGGRVLMVRQFRYAAQETLLELPAGTLKRGEDPREAAQRELQEEVGYRAGRLTHLTSFYSAPGFCTELLHLYLAEELTPSKLDGDEDEDIEVEVLPIGTALERAIGGGLRDAKTLAGLFLAAAHLGVLR